MDRHLHSFRPDLSSSGDPRTPAEGAPWLGWANLGPRKPREDAFQILLSLEGCALTEVSA